MLDDAKKKLQEQGFTEEEIEDMWHLIENMLVWLGDEPKTINWKMLAQFEAERLAQMGKTEKVREYAARAYKKLKQLS